MALEDWKKIVVAPVAEVLKRYGFRKSGLRFSAVRDDAKLLVEFQSSQMSDRHQLKVTVNLAIWLGQLDRDPSIGVCDGHWRARVGSFMENPRDHWWLCSSDEESRRAGEQIASLLEQAVLPEMERLASAEALIALWASGRSPGLTERQRTEYLARLAGHAT
jgi:hypothetical protein